MTEYLWSFVFVGNIAGLLLSILLIHAYTTIHAPIRWASWILLLVHSGLVASAAIQLGIW